MSPESAENETLHSSVRRQANAMERIAKALEDPHIAFHEDQCPCPLCMIDLHLQRIQDALETLASVVTPRYAISALPEPPIGQRCQNCRGAGLVEPNAEYCTCQTGRDLQKLHRDAPGA